MLYSGPTKITTRTMSVEPPTIDELFGERVDEQPDEIDREFWVGYLRDVRGFDASVLAEKPDGWVWSRGKEELNA